ncbi:MAG: prolipoprotein diacylglyceryl transferase [Alistipes sp.]|jgi:prolipoprotein diacylglyceryl transferase|nr:prolipoprotein diacylglyceryl transferase [Alistipes sp.]
MINFLAVTWDMNPVFFRMGSFEVMWYGLCWMTAIGLGVIYFGDFTKREKLSPKLDNIFWWGALATIIGARLGHCLFYAPEYYLAHPIEMLYIREGGMASHGAAVGLLLGLWGFSRQHKLPYIWALDRVMIPVTVGGAVVRIGNLINSEIYGHATDLPWGFIFTRVGETEPMHPTQIYEALCYLVTFAVLVFLYYRRDAGVRRPGMLFGVGLVGVFLTRFLIEYIKNVQEAKEIEMIATIGMNIGQLLSIPFILAGILMIVWPYTGFKLTPDANRWSGLRKQKAA